MFRFKIRIKFRILLVRSSLPFFPEDSHKIIANVFKKKKKKKKENHKTGKTGQLQFIFFDNNACSDYGKGVHVPNNIFA